MIHVGKLSVTGIKTANSWLNFYYIKKTLFEKEGQLVTQHKEAKVFALFSVFCMPTDYDR